MVKRLIGPSVLILATSLSLCLSNDCVADAVGKLHVVDPAQQEERLAQKNKKRLELLNLRAELLLQHARTEIEFRRTKDEATRKQLLLQLDELNKSLQRVMKAFNALRK